MKYICKKLFQLNNLLKNIVAVLIAFSAIYVITGCSQQSKKNPILNAGYYLNHNDTVKYVGMDNCRTCHYEEWESYTRTGMGKSFNHATTKYSATVIGPDSILFDPYKNLYYRPYWENDSTLMLHEYRLEGKDTVFSRREVVDYEVGSGEHTNSHVFIRNGYAFQIPFTYYTQKGMFDLPPGFEGGHNTRYSRKVGLECMSCHNGFPDFVLGSENKYREIKMGIDCERCHGPGEIHSKLMQEGFEVDTAIYIDYSIVNPLKLSPELQNDLCARCHLQGTMVLKSGKNFYDFIAGMPLTDVLDVFMPFHEGGKEDFIMASHYERMRESKCYIDTKGTDGELTCLMCHIPHDPIEETPAKQYNDACLNCHKPDINYCDLPEKERQKENNNCFVCHMPMSSTRDIPHVKIHDHKIAKPKTPEELKQPRVFRGLIAVNNPETDSITVARGYLQEYEAFQPDPQYLDSAYSYLNIKKYNGQNTIWFNAIINYYFMKNDYNSIIKMVENLGNSVVITKYLNEQDYTNYDGWTSYRIGQSFESTGNLLIAKYFYENAIYLAKYNLDFQNKYGTLLSEEGDFVNAKKVFGFIISEYPYHVSAHINLGYVYSRTGDMKLAKNEYEEALSYDPDNIQALINISGICMFQNEKEEAKSYIERILKLEPDNNKALLLRSRID